MGMWACFFYYHELCESDLITISVTTNTAQRDNPNWKTKDKKLCTFYPKIPVDVIIANILIVLFRLGQ